MAMFSDIGQMFSGLGKGLNNDIAGNANAINDPGGLGVHAGAPRTGITWNTLLQGLAQGGIAKKPASFNLMPSQSTQGNPIVQGITDFSGGKNKNNGDMAEIVSIIAAMYGAPA